MLRPKFAPSLLLSTLVLCVPPGLNAEERPAVTAAVVDAMFEELSNAGRWGPDDQLGTLNLITAQTRVNAAREVRDGVSVSLAVDMVKAKAEDRPKTLDHRMLATPDKTGGWATDYIGVDFHGFTFSHMDALCHLARKGQYYNGFPMSGTTEAGCAKNDILQVANGIFARAVLMDIPRLKGVDFLEPGTPVYPEDLEAWEKQAGVKVGPGDAVLVRTGHWDRRAAKGPWTKGPSGLHVSVVRWLKARDVAIVGTDAGLDVYPSGIEGVGAPVHLLVLNALGMPVLDTMDLDTVSRVAAERKRWTFLLTAAPLRVPHGTGSPLNAIATF